MTDDRPNAALDDLGAALQALVDAVAEAFRPYADAVSRWQAALERQGLTQRDVALCPPAVGHDALRASVAAATRDVGVSMTRVQASLCARGLHVLHLGSTRCLVCSHDTAEESDR